MSEKRLTYVNLANNYYQIREVDDNGYCRRLAPTRIIEMLNEQQSKIKELEKENDDLRTTITKQVEAITEMKGIIYTLEEVYVIGEYSSEIEEDVQELKKAYDGTLEDFLNYFKED